MRNILDFMSVSGTDMFTGKTQSNLYFRQLIEILTGFEEITSDQYNLNTKFRLK